MESRSTRSRRRKPPEPIYTPFDTSPIHSLASNYPISIGLPEIPKKLTVLWALRWFSITV